MDLDLYPFFKSIIDMDQCAVVVCNLSHEIIYMNQAAKVRYAKSGGASLVGKSLFACHNAASRDMILKVTDWFQEDEGHNRIYTFRNEKENKDVYMVALRAENGALIGYYEKHEYRDIETKPLYQFQA